MTQRIKIQSFGFPQTWLGRLVAGILAAALLVLAIFFFFVFLVVAGVVILGISLRLLWRARKFRKQASEDVLEGEYSVEPERQQRISGPGHDVH
jgi:hypothetical protein